MRNPVYSRSLVDKFAIKGELSLDGKEITYIGNDNEQQTISVEKCLNPFRGEAIELQISVKMTQDLGAESEED